MGRKAKNVLTLEDGRRIGYGWKLRDGMIWTQFRHPTEPGKYVSYSTGVPAPRRWHTGMDAPDDAHPAAARIILRSYSPTLPVPKSNTWDNAVEYLKTTGIRPKTLVTYQDAVDHVRRLIPQAKGPADITPEAAREFIDAYERERFRRSKKPDAPTYTRSVQTVYNAAANLGIVWGHFKSAGFASSNPWPDIRRPKLPKRVLSIPTEDAFATLFRWLDERFPGWELIRLFLDVKALSGCRLADLSLVRSGQLRGDVLSITSEQDKTHQERDVPLPEDIAARLHAIKGPTYLWERYCEDALTYRKGRRNETTFRPSLVYNAVKWVFRQYQAAHPEAKIRSHDFRKRAITLMTLSTQNPHQTARAIGMTRQNAERYYLDAKRVFDGTELLRRMAGVLRPKTAD